MIFLNAWPLNLIIILHGIGLFCIHWNIKWFAPLWTLKYLRVFDWFSPNLIHQFKTAIDTTDQNVRDDFRAEFKLHSIFIQSDYVGNLPHLFELILAFVLSISQILAIDARKKAIFNDFFFQSRQVLCEKRV